ncbi:MAG: flagellar hook-basal body complex protein FliE [Oscillospiraceae bacterium]|jgi:flagellar hook-basal body complex protein FliE|nr:flagellar hook-basal body complex protein FliE [Oscillospiraceae bacterium]
MAIGALDFSSNYAMLPALLTAGRVQEAMPAPAGAAAPKISFSDFLSEAMADTVAGDYASKTAGIGLLLGEDPDLHSIPIAEQKAEILLNLTVQIRNKMVESYQEIMRMQV